MRKNTGFTLLELMVVISIISIIAAIGTPNFLQWRSNAKLKGAIGNIRSDLERSKLRAIRENAFVAAIFSTNGYTIFVDNGTGTSGDWNQDENEKLLGNIQLPAGITLSTTRTNNRLRFNSRGRCVGITITSANISGRQMDVIVSPVGRIRISSIYE